MELIKPKKIFIVDDDVSFTQSLKKSLGDKTGHDVTVFRSCAECLEAMKDQPSTLVLDSHLNLEQRDKTNDLQLLDIVRKEYPNVHVIMLGKHEGYGTAMQTILHGAEQFVVKDENTATAVHDLMEAVK